MITAETVRAALRDVEDPELPVSIVDLGLVRGIDVTDAHVCVYLTFTAMGCPCIQWIQEDVRRRVLAIPGVQSVDVQIVWDPPWRPTDMHPRARAALARYGVAVRDRTRSRSDL